MGTEFQFPWQYNFPPFFTIQPVAATREQQLTSWRNLITSYHQSNVKWELDVTGCLFSNPSISRSLTPAAVRTVIQSLVAEGQGVMYGERCFVLWQSVAQWGSVLHSWALDRGLSGSVLTLFELHSGDDSEDQPFHTMDVWLLQHIIAALEGEGKAELMLGDSPDFSDAGVKFF